MRGSSGAYSARLASRFSKIASITTSASGTPSPATSARQARRGGRRVLPASRSALVEQLVRALERRLDVLQRAILQRDVEAAQRAPGGDVAAHDAGADHVHVLDGRGGLAAEALQAILQQEHAHQIARRSA